MIEHLVLSGMCERIGDRGTLPDCHITQLM